MHDINGVADTQTGSGFIEFTVVATVVSMAAAFLFKNDVWHVTSILHAVSSILPG